MFFDGLMSIYSTFPEYELILSVKQCSVAFAPLVLLATVTITRQPAALARGPVFPESLFLQALPLQRYPVRAVGLGWHPPSRTPATTGSHPSWMPAPMPMVHTLEVLSTVHIPQALPWMGRSCSTMYMRTGSTGVHTYIHTDIYKRT